MTVLQGIADCSGGIGGGPRCWVRAVPSPPPPVPRSGRVVRDVRRRRSHGFGVVPGATQFQAGRIDALRDAGARFAVFGGTLVARSSQRVLGAFAAQVSGPAIVAPREVVYVPGTDGFDASQAAGNSWAKKVKTENVMFQMLSDLAQNVRERDAAQARLDEYELRLDELSRECERLISKLTGTNEPTIDPSAPTATDYDAASLRLEG